ncbi:MAG: VWA domain-containing protein [Lacipirellulaceae bacterium]
MRPSVPSAPRLLHGEHAPPALARRMLDRSLAFDSPWWLALLGFVPIVWWIGGRGLAGLGRWRGIAANAVRTLVVTLIVFALADAQLQRTSDRVTVLYLLDQSLSVPEPQREAMAALVNAAVREHRRDDAGDRVGVIVFGADPAVELPPVDFDFEVARVESSVDRQQTNLAGALERAMALFPADAAKRVVVVSDGNENVGDALAEARGMAAAGVSFDVVPAKPLARTEVAVEKVATPADARRGQPFEVRVVADVQAPAGSRTPGVLRVVRKSGETETVISEGRVALEPGKNALAVRETLDRADFYTYEARFLPDDPKAEASAANNVATSFTHVRGKGQVLVVEDWEHPGEFDRFVDALRGEGLEVSLRGSNRLWGSLAELQRFDAVVLANTPRSSGYGADADANVLADSISGFSDEQINTLVRNTEELGCGLVLLGGDRALGAGGWDETPLEKAMPLDFEIKASKVTPVGALAIVVDRSGSMSGDKLEMARRAAIAAVRVLSPRDYATVIAFDEFPLTVVPMRRVADPRSTASRIARIAEGGGTNLYPAMEEGFESFDRATDAAVRHMIVLTDGMTPEANHVGLAAKMKKQGITVTSVGVGADCDRSLLSKIAAAGGGKFYAVNNPAVVPRIFQREARRVARPLVRELSPPVAPTIVTRHEALQGIDAVPPIAGFVQTTVKPSSLVEVILRSPLPPEAESSTVLAAWTYGLGKTAVLTTDAGARWANAWTSWSDYDRAMSQLVRWAMRPTGETGNLTVATEVDGGRTRVVLDAVDSKGEFLDLPAIAGAAVGPELESETLAFRQVAPGRYVAEFATAKPGSYLLVVNAGGGRAPIRTGVNIGLSNEFREREANLPLLESIAGLTPPKASPGIVVTTASGAEFTGAESVERLAVVDPFRRGLPPAVSSSPLWPQLVFAACVAFLADVFVRRVQVGFGWLAPLWRRLTRRNASAESPATIDRLRVRKEEVRQSLGSAAAATRFDPTAVPAETLAKAAVPTDGPSRPNRLPAEPLPAEADGAAAGYTSRLLKAKRDAMKKRDE